MRLDNSIIDEVLILLGIIAIVCVLLFFFLPQSFVIPFLLIVLVALLYFGIVIGLARYKHQTPDWLNTAPFWAITMIPVVLAVGLLFWFWADVTASSLLFLLALLFIFLYFWLIVPLALVQKNEQISWERNNQPNTTWPEITVLIPAYKERGHLVTTLDSLAQITYPNEVEIIVIDDGSLDGTYEEARDHIGTDPIVIRKENGGKHSALNKGLEEASHEIIISIDADSWIDSDALQKIVEGFKRRPEAGAIAGNVKVGNRGSFITNLQALEYILGINTFRRAFDHVGLVSVVPGCLGAFRKSILKEVKGYSADTLTEDFDLTIEILKRGYSVHASEGVVYTYAPTKWRGLYKQRLRWFRGNIQTLLKHRDVIVDSEYGLFQRLVIPYTLLSMSVIPVLGIAVLVIIPIAIIAGNGWIILQIAVFFLLLFGMLSLLAIGIDGEDHRLAALSPFSVIGYKQFLDVILLKAVGDVLSNRELRWTSAGRMTPSATTNYLYDPTITDENPASFELFSNGTNNNEWQWRLLSPNGRILAISDRSYSSKEKAEQTLDMFRKYSQSRPDGVESQSNQEGSSPLFEVYATEDNTWRWRLIHTNRRIIAQSDRGYPSQWSAEHDLKISRKRAQEASVRP